MSYVNAAFAERKWNREEQVGQTKDTLPPAKKCRQDKGTERNTGGHAEMSCTQQDAANATEKVTRSANAAKVARKGKGFQYLCPACQKLVTSQIRTGQIDHRRACGHVFEVKDAQVVAKAYDYFCPICKGKVASNIP